MVAYVAPIECIFLCELNKPNMADETLFQVKNKRGFTVDERRDQSL